MHFSRRTAWEPGINEWTETVEQARREDEGLIDLTVSNPTACGLGPRSAELLAPLSAPGALRYVPEPLGMTEAREGVAAYYRDHHCQIPIEQLCLTTSTSEAYSFIFRLLCDPGDEVLIARPSYPLFEFLAGLDDVVLREYPLFYDPGANNSGEGGGWSIDFVSLQAAITEKTRAILVVHPNNPTGHFVSRKERGILSYLCAQRNLALIVDEVFLDYEIASSELPRQSFASVESCLCFVLSGLSKICALPQMKASWILACGPPALVREAMRRLEIIADTFLSMNAPVQFALPGWLAGRHGTQTEILERLAKNLDALDVRLKGSLGERLALEGGWTAVLRVPRFVGDQDFASAALERGVLVQPGSLYGLPEGRCVLSLLTEPGLWAMGLQRLPL